MVLLRTVPSAFHARVLAARLGADGIVTELRGPGEGPYPMGRVHVYVRCDDLDVANELLLADEVESAFDGPADDESMARRTWRVSPAFIALAVFLLVLVAMTTRMI